MEQFELLRYVAGVMDRLGLRYFVTGSVASALYGEPRFTNDIDVVVDLPASCVVAFCRAFPEDEFYVSEPAARQAVEQGSQFNVIHPGSGLKVDVIVGVDTAFNRSRFARVRRVEPEPGLAVSFASAEDVILKKLEYYREGGSDKHVRDIISILKIAGPTVDRAYLADWVSRLSLDDAWRVVVEATSRPPNG
jgi:hypothetical protein